MVERKPLVRVGGKSKQLPDGDKLPFAALPIGAKHRRIIEKLVTFDASSPIELINKPAGWIVERVQVIVDDLWISPTTNITVGTDSQPDIYFHSGLVDFNVYFRAGWEMSPDVATPAAETLYVHLTPGAATMGSVRVIVTIVNPEVV